MPLFIGGITMTSEKKKAFKDILIRAGKTFVQAFLSYLSIDSFFGISDVNMMKKVALSLLVGALASGISAIWNSFIEWLTIRIDEMDEDELIDELEEKLGTKGVESSEEGDSVG